MTSSNTRPILERLAYVVYLAVLVCSIGVTWLGGMVGWETGDYSAMSAALGGLAVSRWLHVHGHAHWHFQEWQDSFDVPGAPGVIPRPEQEEARAETLAGLFAKMEAEPDVWQRGALRREIVTVLQTAPELREEFAENLAAHPEI